MKIKLAKKWQEKIPGGLSVGKTPADFNSDDIVKGINIEMEHTSDIDIATEIAMDHLSEDPEYYNKLEKIENGANKVKIKLKKKMQEAECMDETCGDMVDKPQQEPPADFTGEPDYEGQMAKNQMIKVHDYSGELLDMMSDEMQLPAWVQSKITTIEDYIGAVKHFIEGEMEMSQQEMHEQEMYEQENINEEMSDHVIAAIAQVILPDGTEITPESIAGLRRLGAPMLNMIGKKLGIFKPTAFTESFIFEASCDDGDLHEMEMFYEECGCGFMESQQLEEAEYQGRKVTLNKPMRGDVKKFKVFVKDPKTGNVKKVNFGDPNMRIKKSNPKRRKSFRARHNCDNPGPKTKARYWSCRKW